VYFHKQADKMKHASAVAAEAKASLIQLIKNHSKNIEIAAI